MIPWYVQRVLQAFVTVFAVITLTFGIIRALPGGPATALRVQLIQQGADPDQIDRLIEAYLAVNPEAPIIEAYIDYLLNLLSGDLGQSTVHNIPVSEIILNALPWTLFIMSISIALIYIFGILLGAVLAFYEGTSIDYGGTTISIILGSTPYYIVAIFMLYTLGFVGGYFPTSGVYPHHMDPHLSVDFILGVLHHAFLPVFSFVITGFGAQAIVMRGNSIRVLGEDYIRVARLRALSSRRISTRYVARNAVLPMYTQMMISIGFMFGGSVVLEEIFNYRGVGYYMFQGIANRDYPLMMGAFLVITLGVVVAVFIADLTYGLIDPRVEGGGSRETY